MVHEAIELRDPVLHLLRAGHRKPDHAAPWSSVAYTGLYPSDSQCRSRKQLISRGFSYRNGSFRTSTEALRGQLRTAHAAHEELPAREVPSPAAGEPRRSSSRDRLHIAGFYGFLASKRGFLSGFSLLSSGFCLVAELRSVRFQLESGSAGEVEPEEKAKQSLWRCFRCAKRQSTDTWVPSSRHETPVSHALGPLLRPF